MFLFSNDDVGWVMLRGSRKSFLIVFFIFISIGMGIYANSFDVPFYLDDFRNITENPHVRIEKISLTTLYDAAFLSPLPARPVPNVSFAFNYLLHQESVFGYHLVNVFIHVLTAFFLFLLFSATLSTQALSGRYKDVYLVSFFAALLWLVHPLHTGSVTYIVQRMLLLAVMFYVVALVCYVKGRVLPAGRLRWAWMAGSLLAAVLAMASKEIAVTLPFVIFLYEWYFFQDLEWQWVKRKIWLVGIFLLFVALCYGVYAGGFTSFLQSYENRPFSLSERLYTEFRVVVYYLSLLVYPHPGRLNLDHFIPVSTSLISPATTLLSAGAVIFATVFAFIISKKHRLLSFAMLWYLGNLVIESSFLGLELIFEHRTYLPSVFLIFVFVVTVMEYVRPGKWAVLLLSVILCVFSYWTIERNAMWKDPVRFWADSAAKSPEKARPYMNLSVVLRENGDIDGAVAASQKAISIDPRFVNGYVGLGAAYAAKGDFKNAEEQYKKVLQMMPDYAEVYNSLGVLYINQGRVREAVAAFNENLRLHPGDVNALVNRASLMAYQGDIEQAIADFKKALAVGGKNPDILYNLSVAYSRKGDEAAAMKVLEDLLRINPGDQEALRSLKQLRSRSSP